MSGVAIPTQVAGALSNAPTQPPSGEAKDLTPPAKPASLEIPKHELKAMTLLTPEKKAEKVTLSENTYNTLADTLVYHFGLIDKMKNASPPKITTPLHETFYESFKQLNQGEDLSDPQKLKNKALEFLARGGAEVRLALKLTQWELASLQAASGRMLIAEGHPQYRKEIGKEIIIITTEDGATETITKPTGGWLERTFKGKKILTKTTHKIIGGNNLDLSASNTMLSYRQRNFLKEAGWVTGNLNEQQIEVLDTRIRSLTTSMRELYLKTGCSLSDVPLNIIKKDNGPGSYLGRKYIDNKLAVLIGEGAPGTNMRAVLEAEGLITATEVKLKVEKALRETQEKARTAKAEKTADTQLSEEINKKLKSAPSEQEQQIKKAEIDQEIARLRRDIGSLTQKNKLDSEIPELQATYDETVEKLTERENTIALPEEPTKNLIAWSDPNNAESWKTYEAKFKLLSRKKKSAEDRIAGLDRQMKTLAPEGLRRTEIRDDQGIVIQVIEPMTEVTSRYKHLQDEIDKATNQIYEGSPSLEQQIEQAQDVYERRKTACDTNQDVITVCREAERKLLEKLTLQQKNNQELTQLFPGVTDITTLTTVDIQTKLKGILSQIDLKTQEVDKLGKAQPETQHEIEALNALKKVLPSEGRQNRDTRLSEAKKGEFPLEIVESSEWNKFPPAILRCVQIIFGNEIFLPTPPEKDVAENVFALIKSKKYLDIFITAIDPTGANMLVAPVEGSYADINAVLPAGSGIRTFNPDKIDEKIINTIVEQMRLKTLGLKPI